MSCRNGAGPMILGRDYQGVVTSAVEKFWGQNSSQVNLEPGDVNVSLTRWSISHPLAGNRNLRVCSFSKFMPEPTAAGPGSFGSDTQDRSAVG